MKLRCLVLLCTLVFSVQAQDPNSFATLWQSTFDANGFDGAQHTVVDAAGNMIIAGQTFSLDTAVDGLLIKIDPTGKRLWAKRFDSAISGDDFFTKCAVDADGKAVRLSAMEDQR